MIYWVSSPFTYDFYEAIKLESKRSQKKVPALVVRLPWPGGDVCWYVGLHVTPYSVHSHHTLTKQVGTMLSFVNGKSVKTRYLLLRSSKSFTVHVTQNT